MKVKHLDHLNLTVSNLSESLAWYRDVFGFETVETGTRTDDVKWAIARSGEVLLALYERIEFKAPHDWRDTDITHHRINHYGLRITDRVAWENKIKEHHLYVRYGGVAEFPHSLSWYVLDPTGHEIEVALWDEDEIRFG